jgi:Phage tail lysozyme
MVTYIAQSGRSADGYYDENLINLGKFLAANGYSRAAAAGIAGCVAGESTGNPESVGSGGGGLIGWTPLPAGVVTGDATADLNLQFGMILTYNRIWSQYISTLNAQTDPVAAADYYSSHFERPAVTDSDVRANICTLVYDALAAAPPPPPVIPEPGVWAYGPPGAVSEVVAGGLVNVKLSWSAPKTTIPVFNSPEPPPATGYMVWVYKGKATAANLVSQVTVKGTSVTIGNLTVGQTYVAHVAASSPAPSVAKDVFASHTFVA